ncbi:MAG: hypothetical protein PHW02_08865 [bacterium]|nr:hypothetical protein [bacterium]
MSWSIFSLYMSGASYVSKRPSAGVHIRMGLPPSMYFVSFGNIPSGFSELLKKEGIGEFKIKLTKSFAGMTHERGMLFSQRYKKSKVKFVSTGEFKADLAAERIAEDHLNDLSRFRNEAERVFSRRKPEFVLLDEDRTKYKRVLTEEASKAGVRTVVMQHGITMEHLNSGIPFADDSFTPLYADSFFCWGEKSLRYMEEKPENSGKIIVGGSPNLSFCFNGERKVRDVVIIDQQFQSVEEERSLAYEELIKMLESSNIDYAIYLRMEHNRDYLTKLTGGKVIDWRRNGVREEIRKSRVAIGFTSTALIESLYQGVPAISYDYMENGDVLGLEGGAISSVSSTGEIGKKIKEEREIKRSREEFVDAARKHIAFEGSESLAKMAGEVLKPK